MAAAPDASTPTGKPRDPESRAWLDDLRAEGRRNADAVARLHALLLRGARSELARRRGQTARLRVDLDDLAVESADDALVAVLARLDDFRGLSRFTTWAYKFVLYEVGTKLRRLAWQGREIPLDEPAWEVLETRVGGPAAAAEQAELLAALRHALDALTAHQRRVFTALALNEVPIDVLADRLGTTRGALYKTLHDARARLRAELAAGGFTTGGRTE